MILTGKRINSSLKIFGGKHYQINHIIPKVTYKPVFVEGFTGTAVISLNIDEEFDNHYCFDKNRFIISFWKTLQDEPGRLVRFLRNTEYSQENFERAKEYVRQHEDEPGEQFFDAAMFFVTNRMSRSADGKTFGWSDRLRRGKPEYISSYESAIDNLWYISHRIQNINFYCGEYIQLMYDLELYKNPNVVQYLDPPYLPETRVSKKAYGRHEMSVEDHKDLLDFLVRDCQCITYLSGYNSSLYTSALADYEIYSYTIANSASQAKVKPRKTECLWKI